jgi:hypothetical protein
VWNERKGREEGMGENRIIGTESRNAIKNQIQIRSVDTTFFIKQQCDMHYIFQLKFKPSSGREAVYK